MSFSVGMSEGGDTRAAVQEALEEAKRGLGGATIRGAYVTTTVEHDATRAFEAFREGLPGVPLHGVTTSLGVLAPQGVKNQGHGAVAAMLFGGDEGVARAASSTLADGFAAGAEAARALLAQGPSPSLVLFNASPGDEEAMLEGVASVLPGVPCQGGSAADHTIEGRWSVFTEQGPVRSGVSLLGLRGMRVGTALRTPYIPTGESARVAASGRKLERLGDEPAARVLNRWLKGSIEHQAQHGGNILAQTALRPVGLARGEHMIAVHPAHIQGDSGVVDVFARLRPGDELCSLGATPELLVGEVARVIDAALAQGGFSVADVKGASLIFCAGCAGALGPRIDEGLAAFQRLLPGVPVLGLCTFGEQGFVPGLGNLHQNLSLSLSLFA